MKKSALFLTLIASMTGGSAAFAAGSVDSGFYALIGGGSTFNNTDQSTLDSALRSVGATGFSSSISNPFIYKIQLGYQVDKYFAVEGGYIGSNNETYTASGGNLVAPVSASARISGGDIDAVGIWPIAHQFSLLGKLGVAYIDDSGSVNGINGSGSADGSVTNVTYGLGAKYDFGNGIFARFDWDRYDIGDSNSSSWSDVWLIDLGYKFQ